VTKPSHRFQLRSLDRPTSLTKLVALYECLYGTAIKRHGIKRERQREYDQTTLDVSATDRSGYEEEAQSLITASRENTSRPNEISRETETAAD